MSQPTTPQQLFSRRHLGDWFFRPVTRGVRRSWQTRFNLMPPSITGRQVVLDRLTGKRFTVSARSGSNVARIGRIFADENYQRERLGRGTELVERETAIRRCRKIGRILDRGANAVYSPLYFAAVFPGSEVLGIEPIRGNNVLAREICREHCNVTLPEAGIASEMNRGTLNDLGFGPDSFRTERTANRLTPARRRE